MLLTVLLSCALPSPVTSPTEAGPPCQALRPGPGGGRSALGDGSRAHATARFFAQDGNWRRVDEVLLSTLQTHPSLHTPDALAHYAQGLGDACTAPAQEPQPPTLRVDVQQGVAWVQPGPGPLRLPLRARWVVLDLSALPHSAEGDAALLSTLRQLVSHADLGTLRTRRFEGHPDNFSRAGPFSAETVELPWALLGEGGRRPLAIRVGASASPLAHRVAGALVLASQAVLIGEPVYAHIAESTWQGVGADGILLHTGQLLHEGAPWPARIDPSLPEGPLTVHALNSAQAGVQHAAPERPYGHWRAVDGSHDPEASAAALYAALLVSHGVLDRFWPYVEEVGVDLDQALAASLAELPTVPEGDFDAATEVLNHLAHDLEDGQAACANLGPPADPPELRLPVQWTLWEGQTLVRHSELPALRPGDRVLAIDGQATAEALAQVGAGISTGTPGYLHSRSAQRVLNQSHSFRLQAPGEAPREVYAQALPIREATLPRTGSPRPSGPLSDVGAPELLYLNLSEDQPAHALLALLPKGPHPGLVLDLRAFSGLSAEALVPWLCRGGSQSPQSQIPVWTGPDQHSGSTQSGYLLCEAQGYRGPIAVLIGPNASGPNETIAQMLAQEDHVRLVGQPTAGTSGARSLAFLPGGYVFSFTAEHTLNPDGSAFHGLGVQPDIAVQPDPALLAQGRDPELEAAVRLLTAD